MALWQASSLNTRPESSSLTQIISSSPARFHNKGVYVKVGLQKISRSRSLHKELQLQVDNHNVPLPNIEGLIFLNIPR